MRFPSIGFMGAACLVSYITITVQDSLLEYVILLLRRPPEVGFTDRERLLGDAALAQIKSNAKTLGLVFGARSMMLC